MQMLEQIQGVIRARFPSASNNLIDVASGSTKTYSADLQTGSYRLRMEGSPPHSPMVSIAEAAFAEVMRKEKNLMELLIAPQ
jgi:hypothetical protein